MKVVLGILLAAIVGFGGGWLVSSRRHAESASQQTAAEATWKTEKAYLEQALADARKGRTDVRTVTKTLTTTVTNRLSAQEILDQLVKLDPHGEDESRNHTLRRIVYYLESLVTLGPEAIPTVTEFLKQNKDVDYTDAPVNASGQRVRHTGTSAFSLKNLASTDFLVAPSLRLGLVDVLSQIGGDEALNVLVQVLDTTGRGVEVAYIAQVLEDQAPEKYNENALRAARELLTTPPPVSSPNRLDENSRAYLYHVLTMYHDTTFAEQLKTRLLSPDGVVDRQAVGFLTASLKDQAVPALHAAYQDPRMTSATEKGLLMSTILSYVGTSGQANAIINQMAVDENVPIATRAMTIQGLSGGTTSLTDPKQIQGRLELLNTMRGTIKDERLLRSIDETNAKLQAALAKLAAP